MSVRPSVRADFSVGPPGDTSFEPDAGAAVAAADVVIVVTGVRSSDTRRHLPVRESRGLS